MRSPHTVQVLIKSDIMFIEFLIILVLTIITVRDNYSLIFQKFMLQKLLKF